MKDIARQKYLDELIRKKENGLIKVITGIRRCGKSYLLFTIYYRYLLSIGVKDENIIRVALDDEELSALRDPLQLSAYVKDKIKNNGETYYVFIDEVQYAIAKQDLKKDAPLPLYGVLNGLLRLSNVDVYVTGSNSKLLSKDVMTEFRGRGDEIRVNPLTFGEYYAFVGGDKAEAFEEYALYGGLPLILSKTSDAEKRKYLNDLFREVYFKDILERYTIMLPDAIAALTDDLCSSIGSLTNAAKIENTIKTTQRLAISSLTVSNYLEYLEESFLFSRAKRYDVKGKQYFMFPSKYYCTDIGLRNARLNFRQLEETHIMENVIYNELIARDYCVDVGLVEVNKKDENGKRHLTQCEIDFVVNDGMHKYYIQSALNVDDKEKEATELRPLLATKDFFKKIIITKTYQKTWVDEDGIVHMGLYEFLLNKNSLQ